MESYFVLEDENFARQVDVIVPISTVEGCDTQVKSVREDASGPAVPSDVHCTFDENLFGYVVERLRDLWKAGQQTRLFLRAEFDGSASPNPGRASCGARVLFSGDSICANQRRFI